MTKKITASKLTLLLNLFSLIIVIMAVVLSIILWARVDQLSSQQLNTDLVNSYKNNYTQAQLDNLRQCVEKGEHECPADRYVNSSNWKKEIDSLLN